MKKFWAIYVLMIFLFFLAGAVIIDFNAGLLAACAVVFGATFGVANGMRINDQEKDA